jgi:hypothetical protein
MGREDRCFPVHNVPKNIVYFIVIYIAIDYDYEIIIDYNYECHYAWNYECHYAWNYECHHIVETGPVRATGVWS